MKYQDKYNTAKTWEFIQNSKSVTVNQYVSGKLTGTTEWDNEYTENFIVNSNLILIEEVEEVETVYVDTIMWESVNDMDRIVYSKKHYSEDGITTLCGKTIPTDTADCQGLPNEFADCKHCKKKAEKLNVKIN